MRRTAGLALNEALRQLEGAEQVAPGESARALLQTLVPHFWSHVVPGSNIDAYEGTSRVAAATVLTVPERVRALDPD